MTDDDVTFLRAWLEDVTRDRQAAAGLPAVEVQAGYWDSELRDQRAYALVTELLEQVTPRQEPPTETGTAPGV